MGYINCAESNRKIQFRSICFSHPGSRLRNEDFYVADDLNGIYILTDGMGGYKGGEIASKIAANACHEFLLKYKDHEDLVDDLIDFIILKLREGVLTQPDYRFMGTTLSCVYIQDESIHVINIGDSKVIVVGDIIYQSTDHTYAQHLIDHQFLPADEYRHHPMRHILTRCITAKTQEKYKADHQKILLNHGWNTFFLCSDGVLEALSELETIQLINEEQDIHKIIQVVEQQTLNYSNDNSTAIIVGFNYGTSSN